MTAPPRKTRGRRRGGKGLLPPNPRQWDAEHRGLDLRDELGLGYEERLCVEHAFKSMPEVEMWRVSEIPVAQCFIDQLRGAGSAEWSGAAIPLPGGTIWVVYNDAHPMTRIRATLMEELFHLRLGHPPSVVRIHVDAEARRTYNSAVEEQACASGAAALVPYAALRSAIGRGETGVTIARSLEVSPALVDYRLKVTRLWSRRVRRAWKAG